MRRTLTLHQLFGYVVLLRIDLDHVNPRVQVAEVYPRRILGNILELLSQETENLNMRDRNRGLQVDVMLNRVRKHLHSLVEFETGHFFLRRRGFLQLSLGRANGRQTKLKVKKKDSVMFLHTFITSRLMAKL